MAILKKAKFALNKNFAMFFKIVLTMYVHGGGLRIGLVGEPCSPGCSDYLQLLRFLPPSLRVPDYSHLSGVFCNDNLCCCKTHTHTGRNVNITSLYLCRWVSQKLGAQYQKVFKERERVGTGPRSPAVSFSTWSKKVRGV